MGISEASKSLYLDWGLEMKLVIPLDGSKFAVAALKSAVNLMEEAGARLHLFRVVSGYHAKAIVSHVDWSGESAPQVPYRGYIGTGGMSGWPSTAMNTGAARPVVVETLDKALEREVQAAEDYLHNLGNSFPHGCLETKVVVGEHVAEEIRDYAEKVGADMVVMATHGRTGLARIVMGSVTTDLLHHSAVPVLVVRPPDLRKPDRG